MIREAVITTADLNGTVHITPLGYRERGGLVVLAPFVPSRTLDNLRARRAAVLNFTDDVRIMAGALTGRRAWPTVQTRETAVPRLADSLAHWELVVEEIIEHPERPEFLCRIACEENHRAFLGFNRAQAACVELAILVSRLEWLPTDKIEAELQYLNLALEKTAGPQEREAWRWLIEAIRTHPKHQQLIPQATL